MKKGKIIEELKLIVMAGFGAVSLLILGLVIVSFALWTSFFLVFNNYDISFLSSLFRMFLLLWIVIYLLFKI